MSRRKPTPEELTTTFNVYLYLGTILCLSEESEELWRAARHAKVRSLHMLFSDTRVHLSFCLFSFIGCSHGLSERKDGLKALGSRHELRGIGEHCAKRRSVLPFTTVLQSFFFTLIYLFCHWLRWGKADSIFVRESKRHGNPYACFSQ